MNKIIITQKEQYYSIEEPDKLIEYINNNLTPNEKEKKERGEVFTPIELVKEMLDKLPKEVWSNPHLKWLDPAVGIGNFPVVAYLNLMEGLRDWERDEEKRRTHILENMLYMVEINEKNIIILNKLLCGHKYKLNIFEGDFLETHLDKIFGIYKYDIIMGNPPFNKDGVGKGGGVFWTNFVFKSIEILNNDGYLCFIHPLGWRKPFKEGDRKNNAGRIFYEFKKSGYLHYIHISDEKIPHFPKVDYYIYHNSKKIKKTVIYNKFKNNEKEDEYEINHLRFIPNFINNKVLSVLDKIFNDKYGKHYFNIIYNQSFKPNKSHININGIPHAWTPISQKEYKIAYNTYDIVPEYIKQPKIILTHISGSSKLQGKLFAKYYQNNIGVTNNTMYLLENKKYENYFNSNLITFLMNITQYTDGQYGNNQFKILNLIKNPDGLPNNPTDQDIYDYYGITKQEQQLIEEVVNDTSKNKTEGLIKQMNVKDIQDKIEEFLPIRKIEKDKYGEVFTPQVLIEEMLDKLPKEVWSNPHLKWLDPANGTGNFPMVVYTKLMKGLEKEIENEENRKEHIIKNMLYMVELNEKNVGVSRKIFGKDANIYCGDFLEADLNKIFGIEKFDVIIGNPPFNKGKEGVQTGSRAKNSLWDHFIHKSLDILNINKYLGFINPSQWRGLGPQYHQIWNIISKKQLLYLHIYSQKQGRYFFNVGSRFDLYILQNKKNTTPTEIIDEIGETHNLKIDTLPFLPNYAYDIFFSILCEKGIDVIMSYNLYFAYSKNSKMNEKKTIQYKYPVVHSITKKGVGFWYSNDNTRGHFGVPKVILNFNRHQYSHPEQNDWQGKYGMSQISFGIPISSKKEGEIILKAIQTPAFKTIIKATKWGAFQTDYRMFKYFKKDFWETLLFN